ncbi:MAG: hypothetical protein JXR46_02850 [Calditrichaceae bacterium]|nr:hypothetical protein [Calditrichaceae bacterium]MBN2707962.1 hypothetical protein [Calditrichaceae bacterium]RQV95937.1 MAG: hypothetical protein EH224_06105 [Calditrichota bacterium]
MTNRIFSYIFLFTIMVSCNQDKIESLQNENEQLTKKIVLLEEEIKKLKETDDFYFQTAVELFDSASFSNTTDDYLKSKEKFEHLIKYFPKSNYISDSKKYISSCDEAIAEIKLINEIINNVTNSISRKDSKAAYSNLNKLKKYISQEAYIDIKEQINDELNKPLVVSARVIVTNAGLGWSKLQKYLNKRLRINDLKITNINYSQSSFWTYQSLGQKYSDYDHDISLEVFFDKAKNYEECTKISSNNSPIIDVIGTLKYSNKRAFLIAEKVIFKGDSY